MLVVSRRRISSASGRSVTWPIEQHGTVQKEAHALAGRLARSRYPLPLASPGQLRQALDTESRPKPPLSARRLSDISKRLASLPGRTAYDPFFFGSTTGVAKALVTPDDAVADAFGLSAFGFLSSRLPRFCPLAITVSVSTSSVPTT